MHICKSKLLRAYYTNSDLTEHLRALEVSKILGCLQLSCSLIGFLFYLQFIEIPGLDFKETKLRKDW